MKISVSYEKDNFLFHFLNQKLKDADPSQKFKKIRYIETFPGLIRGIFSMKGKKDASMKIPFHVLIFEIRGKNYHTRLVI